MTQCLNEPRTTLKIEKIMYHYTIEIFATRKKIKKMWIVGEGWINFVTVVILYIIIKQFKIKPPKDKASHI